MNTDLINRWRKEAAAYQLLINEMRLKFPVKNAEEETTAPWRHIAGMRDALRQCALELERAK